LGKQDSREGRQDFCQDYLSMNEIEKGILKTIVYFDLFSYPLKEKEILYHLPKITGLENTGDIRFLEREVKKSLRDLLFKKIIENKRGFYFLKGKEDLVRERERRKRISKKNWQKLKKILKIINLTPFLKGVFVSGSLAISNSNENSDIDLLIVTRDYRIFTVRFFLTFLLEIIGEKRTVEKIAGKICLNHYISENSLKIRFPSIYNAYTYLNLRPVINRSRVFERFREQQDWMRKYLLFWRKSFRAPFRIEKKSGLAEFLEKILSGRFGDWVEKKLNEIQIRRKEKNYPYGVKNGRVILEDRLIELHPDSPEKKIIERYQKTLDFYLKNV